MHPVSRLRPHHIVQMSTEFLLTLTISYFSRLKTNQIITHFILYLTFVSPLCHKTSQESFPHLFILTHAGTECTSIEALLSHKRLDCRELHGCGLVDLMRFIARMPVKGITIPNWRFIISIVYFKFLIFFVFVSLNDLNLMLGLPPTLDPASGGEILARSE